MNTIKKINLIILAVIGLLTINSCVKDDEFALPPVVCNDTWESNLTIAELFALVDANPQTILSFDTEQVIEGYVVSSDSTGNFFKTVSIQDHPTTPTRALQVEMDRTNLFNNFPLGSKIKVSLKGLNVGYDRGALKVGSTYVDGGGSTRVGRMDEFIIDLHVVKSCDPRVDIAPVVYNSINEAILGSNANGRINTLITINNVQFAETGVTYADAVNQTTINRNIVGATAGTNNQVVILRTSGFADFASQIVPEGSGSITAVLSKYNNDWQLFIRDTNDVQFNDPRYGSGGGGSGSLLEDGFNNLNNWTTHSVIGAQAWETRDFGNPAPCAYMSGFASGAQNNEDWLVSKAIAVPAGLTNVTFSFETDRGYNGNALEIFYTTNFTGDVTTTSWTSLPAILDTENAWNTWTNSGDLDVSAAIGGNLYVAFKYTSTTSAAATWELDNVKVVGN